jgi:3-deoxy-7-phosphoheptulonate synthase
MAYQPPSIPLPLIIAGPCQIESEAQVRAIADSLVAYGIKYMLGGVFSAGTYPGDSFGLRGRDLDMWHGIAQEKGLKIVVEVFDPRQVEIVDTYADIIQIGARAMQNYALLSEVAQLDKWVTLKRAPGATLDELLGACEYLLKGKAKPILVERGGASHLNHCRWELSVSLIAAVKTMCNVPILVDASHACGRRDLVERLTLAGIAAGADGCIVECHPDPANARGADAIQTIDLPAMQRLAAKVNTIHREINHEH